MNPTLHFYIESHYQKWIEYAARHVKQSRLPIDPAEVVNDILCSLLEREENKLERLMNARNKDGTELDFFVMRIIKISIHSPRSPFRYQRGQHCTDRLRDVDIRMISASTPDDDQEDTYERVKRIFDGLQVPELSKRIFAWRAFEGKPFADWPGPESQKFLYDTFNRILLIISANIRRKNAS